jgi:hypothetical protein
MDRAMTISRSRKLPAPRHSRSLPGSKAIRCSTFTMKSFASFSPGVPTGSRIIMKAGG